MELGLSLLDGAQRAQVEKQWEGQRHKRIEVNISLDGNGSCIEGLIVEPGVWNPAVTSAGRFAQYIFQSGQELCSGKKVLDVGTGTGVLGIAAALQGANSVLMTDISEPAVYNAALNIEKFKLIPCARAECSDLFDEVLGHFDLIIFNHPFFADTPPEGDTIAASMLAPANLLKKFLTKAPFYLASNGVILMPFYSVAGAGNDPSRHAEKYDFKVEEVLREEATTGLQQGEIFMYQLKYQKKRR